jgi:hypothetical protein
MRHCDRLSGAVVPSPRAGARDDRLLQSMREGEGRVHPGSDERPSDQRLRRAERRLRRALPLVRNAILVSAVALAVAGCVPLYRPATADEPHATLKIRRIYEKVAGTRLDERIEVEGHPAIVESTASPIASAPKTDALLVHLRPARVDLASTFLHQETRTVQEPYTDTVFELETEYYSCGSGTTYQTCSRLVSRSHQVTKYRWVTKLVDVTDATCTQAILIVPADQHVYLIDYTFRDAGVCAATCVEQVSTGTDGSFVNRRCPAPSAEQARALEEQD